tara:strand:- start:12154 stop:12627 length:474 start_codon:yes stop_codon:yes gene_type:complete
MIFKKKVFLGVLLLATMLVAANEYHVAIKNGSDINKGTALKPLKTISKTVEYAYPGDTIIVHEGVYREWTNPIRGGDSNTKRIVYRAAKGEKVDIKGSEMIKRWGKIKKGIWKVTIKNSFFKKYNPYKDYLYEDWFHRLGRGHKIYINLILIKNRLK